MNFTTIKRRFLENAPLSVQQKNIWVEHEIYPDNISYNIVMGLRMSGCLNVDAFKQTLCEIVRRHEIFRTTFSVIESEPRQIIHTDIKVSVSEIALNTLPPEEQEVEIKKVIHGESQVPFDLKRGPLFRFTLLSLSQSEYVFLMAIHHIVMDGWSSGLFSNELTALYEAFSSGKPSPLPEVGLQYSDYAIWQNEEYEKNLERDIGYWDDVTRDAVFGEFPADYPRVFGKKGEGAAQSITIHADLVEKLKFFSRKEHTTLFTALLAGFQTVLHRYTDQENILLGWYDSGRNQNEIKGLLGQYSNLAAIKTVFSGEPDFREIVKRTHRTFFDTYDHGHFLVSNLSGQQVDHGGLSSTLFHVVFNFQNFPYPNWKLTDLEIKPEPVYSETVGFDLEISIIPRNEELLVIAKYRKDLYSENTISRILNHYRNILSFALESPEQPIGKLSIMSPAEVRQITEDWNSEKAVYQTNVAIHRLIDVSARENPDAIALTYRGQDISYKELINRSNYIARILIEMSVGPEVMVGVCMERSHNLIIALLAVLKAGGVYVPLDPIYPDEKLAYMLKNSNATILLAEKNQTAKFPDYNGKTIEIEQFLSQFSKETAYDLPPVNVTSENSAYLIYTSGTTGKPKGVLVTHRNVINEFCFADLHIDDTATSRTWLFSTSISFDPSVLEMFWTLSRGYKVVVLPNDSSGKFLDIDAIPELITKHKVSHFQCTPSILRVLMERADGFSALKQLKKLMVGGEIFPVVLARRLLKETSIEVYNVYGPTETTLWATWHRLQDDGGIIPVGRPLPNYEIYILDKYLQPVPIGAYGEVCIGGDGVARGYFNDQELTTLKYFPNLFTNRPGERIYRTGDIARYRPSGVIEFRGRADRQVKIRGHRIELGEPEAAIMECGGVREAVVIVSGNTEIDQKLLGYVIPELDIEDDEELRSCIINLKEILNKKLPGFMIPSHLTILKEFPKLSNGKIDRKALPLPELFVKDVVGVINELTPTTSTLMKIWEDVLGIDGFTINDNYIDIGGNSLSAIIIIHRIESILKAKLTINDFLDNPTIKQLAKLIGEQVRNNANDSLDRITLIERNDDMPLSFFQEGRLRYELSRDIWNIPYLHSSSWFSIKLSGNLNTEALEDAFNYVINRHEVFRTAFWPVIGSLSSPTKDVWDTVCQSCRMNPGLFFPKVKFKQSILPTATMSFDYYDVSKYDDKDQNIEINIISNKIIQQRFRYEAPPLTRTALIRIKESEHILLVTATHLVADMFSMRIYEKELAHVYSAIVNKQVINLPEIEIQYADYSVWMKKRLETGELDSIKSYWQRQLEGYIPTDVTFLPFTDIEGSENDVDFDIEAKYYYHPISDEICKAIRKYAGSLNMTSFSIAMTGFILCLYCESGKNDIGVLTFFANRIRPETENVIGMFATGNTVRVNINDDYSLYQCAAAVSESLNDAVKNQEYVIELPDSRLRKSLYDFVIHRQITCELLTDSECASFSGLNVERAISGRSKSEYALRLFVIDSREKLSFLFQYNLDLFDGVDIRKIAARIENIIKEIIMNPSKTITFQEGL